MKTCDVEGFSKHWLIHMPVQLSLAKGGEAVELQKPRLQFFVEENVNTKDLVAGIVRLGVLLKAFQESSMAAYDGLADNVPNSCPESGPIMPLGFQIPPESFHAPFVTLKLRRILILNKLFTLLIDCIICQVDVLVIQIVFINCERFCCKANETIVVQVKLDGVDAGQENVESEIELESVDEEGVGDVLLHNEVLLGHLNTGMGRVFPLDDDKTGVENVFGFCHNPNPLSTRIRWRFHNPYPLKRE